MKCTRCDTKTSRGAIGSEIDVENSENGVVWLCDGCIEEFNKWLDNPPARLSKRQIQELKNE